MFFGILELLPNSNKLKGYNVTMTKGDAETNRHPPGHYSLKTFVQLNT